MQCNGGVFLLLPNQKECNKKFADYYNLRNPTSLMYKISILYKYDHSADHLWNNYRIDCGAFGLQIWMHIAIQCNIYIGMSKNLTYTLSISPTADTVCGKGMPQLMIIVAFNAYLRKNLFVTILIRAWFNQLFLSG